MRGMKFWPYFLAVGMISAGGCFESEGGPGVDPGGAAAKRESGLEGKRGGDGPGRHVGGQGAPSPAGGSAPNDPDVGYGMSLAELGPESDRALAFQQSTLALTHVQLVDGTGAPAKADMTVVVNDGRVAWVGPSSEAEISEAAAVIDGTGKTLLPGFVMMHEHMFYPTGKANYTEMLFTFPRLYLAGGATTIRTAGTMAPYADLNLRDEIEKGKVPGPDMDVTGPYINGVGVPILKMHALRGAKEAMRLINYWADEGVTSFKGYTNLTRAELKASILMSHLRGAKMTAHLCSVNYHEAASMGIDNLEHGFIVATDFVPGKQADVCPKQADVLKSLAELDLNSKPVKDLIKYLVKKGVALTSTLTIFETFAPGRPIAPEGARELLIPEVRAQYESTWASIQTQTQSPWPQVFAKEMQLERMFVEAGGLLMAGTDPTGYGGVVAGYSSKRAVELLVEAGFSFEQAIRISTLNGARYLGREHDVGSVEVGKRADLALVDGDPVNDVMALENMPTVFKAGVGYDTGTLFDSMKGSVGLY